MHLRVEQGFDYSHLQQQSVETREVAMVDSTFFLFSKVLLHFQRITPKSVQHLLQSKLHFEGLGRIVLVPRGFMFCFSTEALFRSFERIENAG